MAPGRRADGNDGSFIWNHLGRGLRDLPYGFYAIRRYIDGFIDSGIVLPSLLERHRRPLLSFLAVSFLIEGVNRAALGFSNDPNEGQPFFYFVRFLSFLLILIAIIQKNMTKDPPAKDSST